MLKAMIGRERWVSAELRASEEGLELKNVVFHPARLL